MKGYFVLKLHILARRLYLLGIPIAPEILKTINYFLFNVDIAYQAEIGNIKFPHPLSIVIGRGAVICDNVKISQGVTVGGNLKKSKGRTSYPFINKNVWILANSMIAGPIQIQQNIIIGANSVVTRDLVRPGIYSGSPAIWIRDLSEDEKKRVKK